jgi:hypothetical protein
VKPVWRIFLRKTRGTPENVRVSLMFTIFRVSYTGVGQSWDTWDTWALVRGLTLLYAQVRAINRVARHLCLREGRDTGTWDSRGLTCLVMTLDLKQTNEKPRVSSVVF